MTTGENGTELGFQFDFQFAVTFGFGGLAFEGIDLAGDFFEDVKDAGEVLFGAFEFGFGEAAAALVFGDAGGFFDDGAAVLWFG